MRVTIREVAEAAGVSIATASRALSGRRRVSPELERAVVAASESLGYRANTVARSLRMGATATIGMVVPVISNPYFPLLVEAVERELSSSGRELLLCDSRGDVAVEAARVEALLDRRVDGLLFIACDSRASAPTLTGVTGGRVPVVQLDRYVDGVDADFVGIDNETGMAAIVEHLHAAGCRSFALVSSAADTSSGRLRLRGYRGAVEPLDAASADRVLLGEYSVDWGREAVSRLLAQTPLPDAIVCAADIIALGALAALAEAGVDVPGDVALTGFDDIAFAALTHPPLTTVRQPAGVIGAEAVQMLQDRLAGNTGATQRRLVRPEVVVRGTAPAVAPAA
jgi:LacI family transcriptional regulator